MKYIFCLHEVRGRREYEQEENRTCISKVWGGDSNGEYISKGKGEGLVKHLSTSIDDIAEWFKQYQVESIELWISGLVETGGITRLVVSAKGEGGMRVVLKPRSQV